MEDKSALAATAVKERWPALESNPEVLTSFMQDLGLPPNFSFIDVFDLGEEGLSYIPRPVRAVIFLYEDEMDGEPTLGDNAGDSSTCPPSGLVFIRQIESLGNACGTIAALHAVLNGLGTYGLEKESALTKFSSLVQEPEGATYNDRAKFLGEMLEQNEDIRRKHW